MLNLISQWWTIMASSLVLVLLMDNLPGIFLNKTLKSSQPFGQNVDIHRCDPVTQPIIDLVNGHIVGTRGKPADDEHDFNSYPKINKHSLQDESPEAFQNLFENSVENSKSIEKQLLDSNKYVDTNAFEEDADKSECDNPKYKPDDGFVLSDHFEGAKAEFPKAVPFMVAIFESLQNVTAQTCAGTLVAPRWVLTAASCVGVLGTMYGNTTNTSSSYTVIANSSDPLRGGSVHNVTGVTLHPGGGGGGGALSPAGTGLARLLARQPRGQPTTRTKTPSLALLRVEPAVRLPTASLQPPGGGTPGGDAAVYGWQLHKNDKTNATSMRSTRFAARALSRYECELQFGVTHADAGSVLCLATTSDAAGAASNAQMSIGGPVLTLRGGALQLTAVALPGDSPPLLAAPVAAHAAWIHRVLDTTTTDDATYRAIDI